MWKLLFLFFIESDLYKVIEQTPALLTEASTRRIAYQLILALHYLHSAQIIHRDLKVHEEISRLRLHRYSFLNYLSACKYFAGSRIKRQTRRFGAG